MDNLSAHKGVKIKEMIEQRGSQLVYLPVYFPDLNPIEGKCSRRSRSSCVRPKPGLEKPWSRRLVRRCLRSPLRTPAASIMEQKCLQIITFLRDR